MVSEMKAFCRKYQGFKWSDLRAAAPLPAQNALDRGQVGAQNGAVFIIGGNRGSQTIGYLAAVWYGFALPD